MIDYKSFKVEYQAALYDCGNRLRRRKMMKLLPIIKDKIVLEIGFGIGDFWIELKRHHEICKRYIGVDISIINLKTAIQLMQERRGISLIQADVFNLPFRDNSVDVFICAEVLEHIDDITAMREMIRILKKRGQVLITVPYLGRPVKEWGHLRHYSLEMVTTLAREVDLIIQEINIFGRFHEITWVKIKRYFYKLWAIWKKITGVKTDYYRSVFHRHFIMHLVDYLLHLDDIFSFKKSVLGDKGYLVALLQKK